jgi:ferric-dicitrate binding protein FerR (iron transport regulator)
MTDEREQQVFGEAELRVIEAVRALTRPEADPAFRARLRESFVDGTIDASAPNHRSHPSPAPRRRWRRLVPVAAVAAALLFVFGPALRDPALNITAVEGTNRILLNGELVDCADLDPVQAALQPGCQIHVPDGATVEVASPGQLVMALEGLEFTFPTPPHRWFGGRFESSVGGDGTLRMATAPGFGSSYRLRLGDADLLVRGSVFTVSRAEGEIGINVLEGELEAVMPDGTSRRVGPRSGARIRGSEFVPMEFDETEVERLEELRERAVLS